MKVVEFDQLTYLFKINNNKSKYVLYKLNNEFKLKLEIMNLKK